LNQGKKDYTYYVAGCLGNPWRTARGYTRHGRWVKKRVLRKVGRAVIQDEISKRILADRSLFKHGNRDQTEEKRQQKPLEQKAGSRIEAGALVNAKK